MITSKEYKFLKKSKTEGFNWIARDKDWKLYIYSETPRRYSTIWNFGGATANIREEHFTYIKWEDEKPTKIDDLIRDYESHQEIVGESVKVTIPQYVADWIEEVKGLDRRFKLELLCNTVQMPDDVYDWLDERYGDTDILAKAWLDGFIIEKEKLYTVDLNFNQALGKRNGVIKFYDPNEKFWIVERKLTKAEIESVNPILMQIAKEVE